MQLLAPFLLLILLTFRVRTQSGPSSNWTASPFNAPSLPIAVRSPYLNVWLLQGNNPPSPFDVDVNSWTRGTSANWYVSAVVDDKEYRLLGKYFNGENTPNQTAVEFTATRTSFLLSAGGVQFNMSFLSPIEPNNFTLQSLPFAYLYMTAQSTDGQLHRVRMYADAAGDLITDDTHKVVEWSFEDTYDYVVLSMQLQNQAQLVENNIHPLDATLINAFKKIGSGTTSWAVENIDKTRGRFVGNPSGGLLDNHADPPSTFRPVAAGSNTSVIGISIDWGNISSTPEPAVWAFGVYRNPTMRHLTPKGSSENRSPFFVSEISDPVAAAKFVLDDFPRASFAAQALDARIRADGEAFSTEYADLLMLSARQAMGSMDITIPPSLSGSWDTSDVKIFMKNLGGVGSDNEAMTSVNNVDALYAAFPVFLYLNPEIGRCLLEPLFEFQDSPAYKLPYAARNIGTAYPSATANGINDQHIYGVDETASMIIMTLAYSMASGNGTLIERHYNLMRSWAFYLGNNTVTPSNQASGDFSINADFTSPNQTNLALKGIIGIAAMARIAELAGIVIDQQSFNATANSALEFWQDQALSTSHVNFFYGNSSSSGLMYNLYADKLLRLNLVPDSVYTLLTGFYQNEAASFKYGIPLSNSPMQNTTTYWMMFAAATAKNDTTRDLLVNQIHAYASNNLNAAPFQSRYDPITGLSGPGTSATTAGIASPAQGGMFALLALNTTSKPVKVSSIDPSPNESPASLKTKAGLIAGLVVAGAAVIAISSLGLYFFLRKRRARQDEIRIATSRIEPSGFAHPFILPPPTSEAHTYRAITSNSALISHNAPISIPSGPTNFPRGAHLQWEGERGTDKKREPAMTNATESQTRRPTEANMQVGTDRLQGVDALLSEVDAMRQEIERMRHERRAAEDAPPTYSDPDLS